MSRLIRLISLTASVAALGLGFASCGDSIKNKVDQVKSTYTDAKTTVDQAKDDVDDATKKGDAADSLFNASNLGTALDKVKAKAGDDAIEVDIYPGYAQVDSSTGSETEGKRFKVDSDGNVDEAKLTLSGPGKLADNIFPIADVDPAVIDKTISDAAAKAGKTKADVTYARVVMGIVSGKTEINVYIGSDFFTANLDGSGLKNTGADAKKATDDASKTVDCIKAAGTDVSKIQACSK